MLSKRFTPAALKFPIISDTLAIKDFKTYEDSSLQYLGLTTHKFERYGLMDTVVSKKDLNPFFENKGPYKIDKLLKLYNIQNDEFFKSNISILFISDELNNLIQSLISISCL